MVAGDFVVEGGMDVTEGIDASLVDRFARRCETGPGVGRDQWIRNVAVHALGHERLPDGMGVPVALREPPPARPARRALGGSTEESPLDES